MKYIGYFRDYNNKLYEVIIEKDNGNNETKEITLAGDAPFIVNYNDSSNLFDGLRTSTATISIVADNYLEDILPNTAMETKVTLKSMGITEWVGYLTPQLYDQGYENCIETIEFEAADCLSALQYIDYNPYGPRGIKSFLEIIRNIIWETGINKIYWPATRKIDNEYALPELLNISEENFFSSDTDESWKGDEVVEEICKYLGFTALQYKDGLYFIDYTAHGLTDSVLYYIYDRNNDFNYTDDNLIGGMNIITEKDIKGNGQNITFEPIYNKFVVRDNFYTSEDFISNIFDDNYLTNRGGDFYSNFQIDTPSEPATYFDGASWFQQKYVNDANDRDFTFFHRLYDHKDYQSVYRDFDLNEIEPDDSSLNNPNTTRSFIGGTIVDLGVVKNPYFDEEMYQYVTENNVDWERYLVINQHGRGSGFNSQYNPKDWRVNDNQIIFKSKPGTKGKCILNNDAYLIINYSLLFTRYLDRNYINPEWSNKIGRKSIYEGGTLSLQKGNIIFKLGIGGKYWDGESWVDEPTTFVIKTTVEKDGDDYVYAYIMRETNVVNNVNWDLNIDEEGYKIPLMDVDTTKEIDFAIYLPNLQIFAELNDFPPFYYNQYCWIKNLSIKTANANQDIEEEEKDVVYENIVNENNIMEMDDVELKITTASPTQKPSYSNVIIYDSNSDKNITLSAMTDVVLNQTMTPEENIITRYHKQYSTPTKRLSYTLPIGYAPFEVYMGIDFENQTNKYIQLGAELDYQRANQTINFIQIK